MVEYEILAFISLRSNIFFWDVSKGFKIEKHEYVNSHEEWNPEEWVQGSPSGKIYLGNRGRTKKKEMQR